MNERGLIENEETLIIETPERVQLEFSIASIGNRFLAVAIDHAIQFSILFLVFWVSFTLAGSLDALSDGFEAVAPEMSKWVIALMILLLFLVFTGYFVFFEWLWSGQTPGKRLLKLRVIREDGRPVTLWEALARNIIRLFDNVPSFLLPLYSVGLITVFLSRRDQRIGDMFAGTIVVRERSGEAPTFAETFATAVPDEALRRYQSPVPFSADISSITESEIEVAETFLRRRLDVPGQHRAWLAWRVALPIMYKLKPDYDKENFSYEGFLEELVHRYNARRKLID